jgi:small conductance mechanosensitive channel
MSVSGLFVLSDRSYEIGDMIEIVDTDDGTRGFVEDITFQNTKIFTLDNTSLVVPNSIIRDRDVINYSAEDPRTRLSLDILVTYEGDLAQARGLIEQSAREVNTVIHGGPDIRIGSARYPAAPTCYINEYADHGVLLTLRYWVEEPYKLLTVRSRIQENIWSAFDGADVGFPYPHTHVVFGEPDDGSSLEQDGSPSDREKQ